MWQELAGRRLLRNTGVAMETTSAGASCTRAWSRPPAGEHAVFWEWSRALPGFCRNNLIFRRTAGSSWGHIVKMEPNLRF